MKLIIYCIFLMFFAGCSRIANLKTTGSETTGDPIYDNQTEMRVVLPWDWFI